MINTYISSFTYSRSLILNILFKELKTKEQSCLENCNWIEIKSICIESLKKSKLTLFQTQYHVFLC